MLSLNLLGDGVRDALDPRAKLRLKFARSSRPRRPLVVPIGNDVDEPLRSSSRPHDVRRAQFGVRREPACAPGAIELSLVTAHCFVVELGP
jgi:hypothetical protein